MSFLLAIIDWLKPVDRGSDVARMSAVASYRAPDGLWCRTLGDAALAHGLRATTTRQTAGGDPIFVAPDGSLAVLCDARFDNLERLHRELDIPETESDAELVAQAYSRWDVETASHLTGEFAFVVWDRGRRRLYAARDRFGARNLHYRATGPTMVVATEAAQFQVGPDPPRDVDPLAVLDHLAGQYAYHRLTFLQSVSRIEPGHFLLCSQGDVRQVRYWDVPHVLLPPAPIAEYTEEFVRLFRRAVRSRIEGPKPAMMHLSGGLDSSSIVCVAMEEWRRSSTIVPSLGALSATFPGLECDESAYIDAVRAKSGVCVRSWNGSPDTPSSDDFEVVDASAPWGRVLGIGGGPPGDFEIAREAGARVLLFGEGGNQMTEEMRFFETVAGVRGLRCLLPHYFAGQSPSEGFITRMRLGISGLSREKWLFTPRRWRQPLRLRRQIATWNRRTPPLWLGPKLRAMWPGPLPNHLARPTVCVNDRQKAVWDLVTSSRQASILDYADQTAARYGLEARYPFLDDALAAFMLSLPESFIAEMPEPRGLHKAAMRGVVPDIVLRRPLSANFNWAHIRNLERAAPSLRDVLAGQTWVSGDYVDQRQALSLMERLMSAPRNPKEWRSWDALRAIAGLEIWLRAR